MTANELADIVDRWAWKESAEYLTDAAIMLRQQAKKIEDLLDHNVKLIDDLFSERKEVIRYQNDIVKQQEFVCQQAKEIADLRKELALQKLSDIGQEIENEPVAWMLLGLEDRKPKLINPQVIDRLEGTWIPLYTHANEDRDSAMYATGYWKGIDYKRMRELTDEEILNEAHLSLSDAWIENIDDMWILLFARAILKKASNK